MKRTSRWRLARVAILTAAALLIGTIAPSLAPAEPASAATDGQMVYPASGTIQSKVGDGCRSDYRKHDGIDISGQGGTPILAAYDGVIKTRAWSNGYGYYVDIQHAAGYVTRYAHMVAQGSVAPGASVVRGQQIGIVGSTGNSTGAHLHFEVWRNGTVFSAINDGFVCLSTVARGGRIPLVFPGLGTIASSPVMTADYNGDGKADLLGIAGDSDLHFLAGNGAGGFAKGSIITSAWGIHRHLTHTDLNGDGRADILVARSDGVLEYYAGNATGGFGAYSTPGSGWYGMLHVTSGADFSGDGHQDVLGASATGSLTLYRGNGTGALPGPHTVVGSGWNTIRHMVGGDFNGDRLGDIMAVADNGTLYFYPGLGGRFGTRVALGSGWGSITALTGGVDYNGDKHADLIARTSTGELYLYPGDGTGRFKSRILIGSGWGEYLQLE
ncbi:VCBS repeat domain-containing M23 family metallopeptidase [Microbacterium sp.]|uniref:VCBS repeat domain-containing M23 family metallopeptidase n=1 Tax=Microbacterium sp. TaxID=51671 RepID=UPI0027367FB5|nr:VCBS repeat domain-containing M23 family metallopeptidase [Microbacterium sp.]MDP3950873.1 VCBS repeat domain-containing M23 family metallopeptidase [Microbacterium sp.]